MLSCKHLKSSDLSCPFTTDGLTNANPEKINSNMHNLIKFPNALINVLPI